MTIKEIYEKLKEALSKLQSADTDDDATLDLEILVLQLKKQLLLGGFDPLKELSGVTVADVSKLPQLVQEVDEVIENETKRVKLIQRIISTAKIGLKAAGLPIPS
jgi:hypothetical protein